MATSLCRYFELLFKTIKERYNRHFRSSSLLHRSPFGTNEDDSSRGDALSRDVKITDLRPARPAGGYENLSPAGNGGAFFLNRFKA